MCSQKRDFEEALMEFVSKRAIEDLEDCLAINKDYVRINGNIIFYMEKIKDFAPSEHKDEFNTILENIDIMCSELEGIIASIMYMQGLKDGYRLKGLLDLR